MLRKDWTILGAALLVAGLAAIAPVQVEAFCGSYVSGGEADLFNNATQAVMMRHDKTTVLSMQNNYDGPPKEFAMIVPTPVVLQKDNVKTLDEEIFGKIDRLTAPRLVEYWEKDPCAAEQQPDFAAGGPTRGSANDDVDEEAVKVEAKFAVGEYNVVVLSSSESTALETWLNDNGFNIPSGAAPYLEPYVQQGSKFFVAKVDPNKVKFEDGQAVLSPLRFHYESDQFKLPIRLGLINSKGKQDLIVNILAQDQRYEVANYPNTTIPTNIEVVDGVREHFPSFYRALFEETLRQNKKDGQAPVVTEYSWNASTCDPCPGPALTGSDMATLGADVINNKAQESSGVRQPGFRSGWVITRLHARYGKDEIGKDLVFKKAEPIVGGRERYDEDGNLERGANPGSINNFQGRYIIRHRWDEAVLCEDPQYGRWGGPPGDSHSGPSTSTVQSPNNGGNLEQPETDEEPELSKNVRDDIPELGVKADPPTGPGERRACSQAPFGNGSSIPLGLLALVGGIGLMRRRFRRRT